MELLEQIRSVIAEACERFPNDQEASAAIQRKAAFFGGIRWDSPSPHIQAARLVKASEQVHKKMTKRGQFFWWEQWTAET